MSAATEARLLPVTTTFLPPLEDYLPYLEQVWETARVTTMGPLACELTRQLIAHLNIDRLLFVSSGTTALQVALQSLASGSEVITTPFTYVATVSSIAWTGRRPVLADIDPETLTIDPRRVEAAITDRTAAILATHVYGYPCDVEALRHIADRHRLPLLFDAAACFGVRYQGRPLIQYGDIATLSFHATKVFHTVEGGAILASNDELHETCLRAHNQGHLGLDRGFIGLGTNAKNSELHAAMGLAVLPHVNAIIARRRALSAHYDDQLAACTDLRRPVVRDGTEPNYSYYPVIFPTEASLMRVQDALAAQRVMPRRYFHPSLTTLDYVDRYECPVSEDLAQRVLCLPLAPSMSAEDVERVTTIIRNTL